MHNLEADAPHLMEHAWWRRALAVAGAASLAVGQPLLSAFGENPAVFESLDITGSRLVLLAIGLVVGPPVLLWGIGESIRVVDERAGHAVHIGTVQVLVGLFLAQILVRLGFGLSAFLLGLVVSPAIAWAYGRYAGVRTWLQVLSALGLVALVAFFGSDAADLIDPQPLAAVELDVEEPLPDVFILVLDELPTATLLDDDELIDADRFPNLAAFADTATWYRRHTTVSPFTEFAIPTLLTGRDPTDAAPFAAQYPDNLFTLFGESHRLRVSEALTGMCGVPACSADIGAGAEDQLDADPVIESDPRWGRLIRTTWSLFREKVGLSSSNATLDDFEEEVVRAAPPPTTTVAGADPTEVATTFPPELERFLATRLGSQPRRFTEFLESVGPGDDPMLGFLHLVLPHQPWEFTADGTQYAVPPAYNERIETLADPWQLRINAARHVEQTRYADGLVGEFLAALVAADRFDDALVIVLGDHGIDFEIGTHPRQISASTIDGVAFAPLLIKAPGQEEAVVSDENVMSIDVLPTVAAALGVDVPWEIDGAPADSAEVASRDATKRYGDFVDPFDPQLNGIETFDGDAVWKTVLTDRNNDLYEGIDAAALIGAGPSWNDAATPVAVELDMGSLAADVDAEFPLGVVSGAIIDDVAVDAVALVLDGEIVAVSPIFPLDDQPQTFALLVPPAHLGFTGEVELAVLVEGVAGRVTVR